MPKIELTTAAASETSTEAKAGELVKQSISHHIFPELALVDSTYLQTASKTGCINTAVDTLAHLVESHLNTNATPYSRVYSEMGLRTFAKVKDALASYEIGEAQRELYAGVHPRRYGDFPHRYESAPRIELSRNLRTGNAPRQKRLACSCRAFCAATVTRKRRCAF